MFILKSLLILSIFLTSTSVASESTKERLVLMPLRLDNADKSLNNVLETALSEGLQKKYTVFSGDYVQQKAKNIFNNESKIATKECDETKCMQDIAIAFQSELIAVPNITKRENGYFMTLTIQNIFDNTIIYSRSIAQKINDEFELIETLKELTGTLIKRNDSVPIIENQNKVSQDIWTDKETHLMWQDAEYKSNEVRLHYEGKEGGKVWDWENANLYCENLTYAGYDDWKLPTIDQLKTILSPVKTSKGYMKEGLKHIAWTYSSEDAGDVYASSSDGGKVAWLINFAQGRVYTNLKEFKTYVRCVRDYKE